jgi:integrase
MERHIKPLLGSKRVRSVTHDDVEKFQRDVASGKTAIDVRTKPHGRAIVRGGEGTAARATVVLSTVFAYAVKERIRADNPVRGITLYEGEEKERYLSPAELASLGEALTAAEENGVNPYAVAAIRMLVFTGCRKAEILTLRWDDIDWEHGCLRLPDSKTGKKTVTLGAPAVELLHGLPRVDDNPYVFPGAKDRAHLVGLQKIWHRLRNRPDLPDVRLHDLRHSFASVGAAGGDSLLIIGKLLGHKSAASTQRYAHLGDDPLRSAANRISQQIAAAMGQHEAEVVELKKSPA